MAITEQELVQLVDVLDQRIQEHLEQQRTEFYNAIQQLIHNQQALVEMIAQAEQPDTMTVLAHGMWQRGVMQEAQRIQAELDAGWSQVKEGLEADDVQLDSAEQVANETIGEFFNSPQDQTLVHQPEGKVELCPNRMMHNGNLIHPPECPMCGGTGRVPVA